MADVFDEMKDIQEEMSDTLREIYETLRDLYSDMPTAEDVAGSGSGGSGSGGGGEQSPGSKAKKEKPKGLAGIISGMGEKAFGMGEGALAKFGIKLGGLGAALAGATLVVAGFVAGTLLAADHMIKAGKSLAKFNGQLAGAYAMSSLREFQRNIRSADSRSESLSALIEAVDDWRDTTQPFFDLISNVVTKILTAIVKGFTLIAQWIGRVLDTSGIQKILTDLLGETRDANDKNKKALLPANHFFMDRLSGRDQHLDPGFAFAK